MSKRNIKNVDTSGSDSQATKKQRHEISTASSSSNEETQEVKAPLTENLDQTFLAAVEKTPERTISVEDSSDEFLQLIADEEEPYDAEYEKVLGTNAIETGTLLRDVRDHNEQALKERKNKEHLISLLSGALVKICFDQTTFGTSNISIPESKISAIHKDLLSIMNSFIDLSIVNKLCLQGFSTFPLLIALSMYSKQDKFYMRMNGGGKYKVVELQHIAKSLDLKRGRLHSDLDFYIDKTKLVNKYGCSFPNTFYPYFGVYELKKTSEISSIETHYDFIKMIGVLRAIAKSYAVTLKMGPVDLEKICLWGILQSSTTIWFLQCKIETNQDMKEDDTFSLLYKITCSKAFDFKTDNEQIIKLYCKVFEGGKQLQVLLENFKQDPKSKYPNTVVSKQLSKQNYTRKLLEEEVEDFLLEKSISLKCMSPNANAEVTKKFIADMFDCFKWSESGRVPIANKMITYIARNQSKAVLYLLVSNILYEIPTMVGSRIINPSLHYVICREEAMETEIKYIVFQFTTNNVDESPATKTIEKVPIESDCSSSSSQQQSGFTQVNNQQQQQQQSTSQNISNYYLLPLNSLEIAFEKATGPFNYEIYCKHVTEHAMYCCVSKKYTYGAKFLKVTRSMMHLESFEVMNKLLNKELNHKNLMKVWKYYIALGPDKSDQIVVATETEILQHYTDVILEQFNNKIGFINWMTKDVLFGALDGLHYLHQNEILHGDISINNVMFRKEYRSNEIYAVLIDLNDSIPFSILKKRPRFRFGSYGYVPDSIEKPCVFTDCYGLVVTICVLVYYALFNETIDLSKDHRNLPPIFDISNWKLTSKEEETVVKPFITNLHKLYQTIVVEMKIESVHSAEYLKNYFRTKLQLVSNADKENIPVQNTNNLIIESL